MTTAAETLASEATTNGAEPVAKATVGLLAKATSISGNLGVGFLGVAISATGASIAAQSFKHAWKVIR